MEGRLEGLHRQFQTARGWPHSRHPAKRRGGQRRRRADARSSRRLLMPGLWDVHIHPDYLSLDEMPLAGQVTLFGHRLAAALTESGIIGLRCAGAHHFMDVAWKRAFDSGQHLGPRLFASGYFLTTTGGHFLTSGHALEVDGPYGWVKAIREQIKNGVDHIKLNLSGGIMGPAGTSTPIRSCSTTRSALPLRSVGSAASRSWRMPPTRMR